MAFVKPQINKTVTTLNKLRIYLRSVKKFGKSTLFRDLILEEYGNPEKGLLVGIGNEIGYTLLDNLNCTHVDTWKDFMELKKWLIQGKVNGEHEIEIVAFDVIDEIMPIIEKEVCRLSTVANQKPCDSINKAFGGYGKGQEKVKELLKEYFSELYKAGFGIFAIAHTKTKNIIEKGFEESEGYMTLTSNLPNTYEGIFGDIFDVVLTGLIDREVVDGKTTSATRKLYFRGTSYVDAGCRFAKDAVPEYMEFEQSNNAREFIDILKNGMKDSMSKPISTDQFKKLEEKEKETLIEDAKKAAKDLEEKDQETENANIDDLRKEIKSKATTESAKSILMKGIKSAGKSKFTELTASELRNILDELNK
ncbi:AAA family ATPase [Terrisporobacter sp.]|uniref:AAA family ATPase n=1 Tax=Terrisporobacter sp. TaxID=1965305 RepID=UPI0026203293|nr:AAA family ATPase [Terrisporobacter sp.]